MASIQDSIDGPAVAGRGFSEALMDLTPAVQKLLDKITAQIWQLPDVGRVYLYGSYAKGSANRESDVDVAVFFTKDKDFFLEEYRQLVRICIDPDIDVQVQAFSLGELDDPCGIIEEIVAFGVELPPPGESNSS